LRPVLLRGKPKVAFSRLLDVPNDAFETPNVSNASFGTFGTARAGCGGKG